MNHSATRTPHWTTPEGMKYLGPHEGTEPIEVTVVLRRRQGAVPTPAAWPHPPRWVRGEYGKHFGADPLDLDSLRGFASKHGLTEASNDLLRRVLRLRGTPSALEQAFSVKLGKYQLNGYGPFVGCGHAPTLPPEAIAVLGLDRRPVARPQFRKPLAQPSSSFTPIQIGQLYNFPAGTDGTGETIGIIELGGGFSTTDLNTYFSGLGITPPKVIAVSVDGGQNQPGGGDADIEVMLDIEMAGALAPGATIAVYFTPNTDQGFYDAISQAAHDTTNKPSVISISWGGPEDSWNSASRTAMETALQDAAALGVTVTVAAGDNGSSDGESDGQPHVDFPASSPYSLACGGTTLDTSGTTIQSEVVWNETASNEGATGGGVSIEYDLPTWQQNANVPKSPSGSAGRGVPDVAGNADPATGYQVLADGQSQVIGGTSAVAPLWAALIARLNQKLGTPVGDVHAALYQIGESAFRDITQGNNGSYQAGPGWDACTGLGSPNGQALLNALTALKGP
ncbi:S53 family peptidase [Dyella psychrodurans]|uniref:Peptidase S53 n=1 Tax=Dyella psychrodurans TaxID=1927960 RepID=A0A370X6X7_9GAMM|nr:S53 family peptidase [Dyella psychrodurans]RDS84017.1 peptidase S53 [Dyella psychrodurans]